MRGLSLCAGIGALDLGIQLAVPGYRTVGYVERDPFAVSVLAARMEDGLLDIGPVWPDLQNFDGHQWKGKVDVVHAGPPCQPVSIAGKRRGPSDERWLWDDVHRVVGESQPAAVFLENVHGIYDHLGRVLGPLVEMGLDLCWGLFSARSLGAAHVRERVFILARHPERWVAGRYPCRERAEFSAGWPQPGSEPGSEQPGQPPGLDVHRDADGSSRRVELARARCVGNAVVPVVAAAAWCELSRELDGELNLARFGMRRGLPAANE